MFKIKLAIFILFASVGFANAYTINLKNIESFDDVKDEVMSHLDKITEVKTVSSEDARKEKINVALDFEDRHEEHKANLRELADVILGLTEIKDNNEKIQDLKASKKQEKENLKRKIRTYRENISDIYLPVVYASFIAVPTKKESKKTDLLKTALLEKLVKLHGVENVAFSSKVSGNKLVKNFIALSSMGTIEEDGTKSMDRPFINRHGGNTEYLDISVYRFKPFEKFEGDRGYKGKNAKSENNKVDSIKFWNLTVKEERAELISFIKKSFPEESSQYLKDLNSYLKSLEGFNQKFNNAQKRIDYTLSKIDSFTVDYRKEIKFIDSNIKRLKKKNKSTSKELNLKEKYSGEKLDKFLQTKKNERFNLENIFKYKFIMIEEYSSSDFRSGLKHSLNEALGKIESRINKKSVDFNSFVSRGVLGQNSKNVSNFNVKFPSVEVKPFVGGSKVGVLLTVNVNYKKAAKSQDKAIYGYGSSSGRRDETYVENIDGMKIIMLKILDENNYGSFFYVSKKEVSKKSFYRFLKDHPESKASLDGYCVDNVLSNYPSTYPMRCVGREGKEAFVRWLNVKTSKGFTLLDDESYNITAQHNIYKGKGFRIKLD